MTAREYSKTLLINDLDAWSRDERVLACARTFLAPDVRVKLDGQEHSYETRGLGALRIANWKRRGIPDGVIEGAALYHCGRPAGLDASAMQRTQLVAQDFWQVFVVASKSDEQGKHDCDLYRYWSGVQRASSNLTNDETYLTHKTWFTGAVGDDPDLWDIANNRPLRKNEEWRPVGGGHELSISTKVEGKEPRDYGYRVHLNSTVESKPPKPQRHEYLGGLSVIPVQRLLIIASIPMAMLAQSTDLLADSKFKTPQCLEFLAFGVPTHMLEDFLTHRLERRWLSPWFSNRGEVRLYRADQPELPPRIVAAMKKERVTLTRPDCEIFIAEINAPAPYLYYSLVFELGSGQ